MCLLDRDLLRHVTGTPRQGCRPGDAVWGDWLDVRRFVRPGCEFGGSLQTDGVTACVRVAFAGREKPEWSGCLTAGELNSLAAAEWERARAFLHDTLLPRLQGQGVLARGDPIAVDWQLSFALSRAVLGASGPDWVRFVGIDPGTNVVLTCADACHGPSGCCRASHCSEASRSCPNAPADAADTGCRHRATPVGRMPKALHRGACGSPAHARWLARRANRVAPGRRHSMRQREGVEALRYSLACLPARVRARCALLPDARTVYASTSARDWLFRRHCLTQRQLHRCAQLASWGFVTCQGKWGKRADPGANPAHAGCLSWSHVVQRVEGRRKPLYSFVGCGNAGLGWAGLSGRLACPPLRAILRLLRSQYCVLTEPSRGRGGRVSHAEVHKRRGVFLCVVDEWMTSQTCSRCGGRAGEVEGCRRLLACQGPCSGLVVDRDVNAARNICCLLLALLLRELPDPGLIKATGLAELAGAFKKQLGGAGG